MFTFLSPLLAALAPANLDVSRRSALQGASLAAGALAATTGAGAGAQALAVPRDSGPSAATVAAAPAAAAAAAPPLVLPAMGIGAWAWGDSLFWKYDAKFDFELEELFEYYASQPDAFLDTAELYGLGRSEMLIGDFERRSGKRVKVASKFAALPWKTRRERCHRGALVGDNLLRASPRMLPTRREDVVQACEASLRRMGRSSMELYQIHFPNAWANEARGNGLRVCCSSGNMLGHVSHVAS